MTYNSLKNLFITPRKSTQVVAFNSRYQSTWLQFSEQVSALSAHLKKTSTRRWALCCEDSYQFAVAFFALAYAEKEIVLPGNQQPEMLKLLTPHFDAFISDILQLEDSSKMLCQLPFDGISAGAIAESLDLHQIKITLFTSGSSGSPKAIYKTLALLDAEIQHLELQFGELFHNTKIVSSVSHQHIYGLLFRVLWPLVANRPFQSEDLVYPEQLALNALDNQILISSPALLKRLTDASDNNGYRAIFSSGGPLSYEAVNDCFDKLKQLPIEVFGSTETGGIGFRQQRTEQQPWLFFSGLEVALNKDNCLKIKSPWIDFKRFYQTSDQCDLLGKQQFILKGRIDRVVKIEEKRISLSEVELRMNELPWVKESAVLLLSQQQLNARLGAVITLTEAGGTQLNELGKGPFWILLRQHLRRWIEPVAVPRYFRVVREIPVNKQGKRLHNELSELFTKSDK